MSKYWFQKNNHQFKNSLAKQAMYAKNLNLQNDVRIGSFLANFLG